MEIWLKAIQYLSKREHYERIVTALNDMANGITSAAGAGDTFTNTFTNEYFSGSLAFRPSELNPILLADGCVFDVIRFSILAVESLAA